MTLIIVFLCNRALSQSDSIYYNQINIKGSNIRNSTIIGSQNISYLALDSSQIQMMQGIKIEIENLNSKMAFYTSKIANDQKYKDSIISMAENLSIYQKQIDFLKKMNDSIMQTKRGDELFYEKLNNEYNQKLKENWSEFWENNPEFNPEVNIQIVEYIEKTNRENYKNIFISGSPYTPTFVACNLCIRQYAGEWWGISIYGKQYKFGSEEFNNIMVFVPNHGQVSILEIRENYRKYWETKKNKANLVDKPYQEYILNKKNDTSKN